MTDERDRSIDLLLRQRRQDDADVRTSEPCVDAEVLAAWMDGSLSGSALADAEQHAAGCARCQALLASMAKTAPHTHALPWWRTVTARWLVPVAAIATALVVWVAVEQGSREAAAPQAQSLSVPPEASQAAVSVEPQVPPQNAQQMADARSRAPVEELKKQRAAGAAESVSTSAPLTERESASRPQRPNSLDRTADAISPRADARRDRRDKDAAARPAAPPPASTPSAATAQSAPAPPSSPPPAPATATGAQTPRPQGSPPVAGQPSPQLRTQPATPGLAETVTVNAEAASKQAGEGRGGGRVAFAAATDIRSPQPDHRWRIVPPSGIQRSTDGGVTWTTVDPVPPRSAEARLALDSLVSSMALTTGSSPSRDVCWIVGRAGIVLLTTDGATWQRRPIPEAADLTAVRAVDAKSATVTTVDGRQFVTTDGGVTWTPSRQEHDMERD
jgi:Photosynthesis system II assembly factor YCF48